MPLLVILPLCNIVIGEPSVYSPIIFNGEPSVYSPIIINGEPSVYSLVEIFTREPLVYSLRETVADVAMSLPISRKH